MSNDIFFFFQYNCHQTSYMGKFKSFWFSFVQTELCHFFIYHTDYLLLSKLEGFHILFTSQHTQSYQLFQDALATHCCTETLSPVRAGIKEENNTGKEK